MALYSYQALSKTGKKISGTVDASSQESVREQLTKQGLYPISIMPIAAEGGNFFTNLFGGSISTKQKINLTKQFAILIRAGIPLLQALELLTDQFTGTARRMLISIKDEVKTGISLADALSKYPKTFDTVYVQLVRAGEATGKLDTILDRLRAHLERQEAISKKISGALQQPLLQLAVALGVVLILITFVVPKIAEVFAAQGKELPFATRILMATSNFVLNHYLIIIGVLIAALGSFLWWKSTETGAHQWDRLILRIPLVSYIARTSAVVQFCYTLGLLLEGGVNLAQALDIVCAIMSNRVLAHEVSLARDNIIKQGKISEYLQQTGIFPPMAIYLMQTGEQSGQLDTMLLTIAKTQDDELAQLIDTLTGMLGPAMLVIMGVVVGFIVLAVAGPMMQGGGFQPGQ
jgi:type II secretory pathway component PulF